MAGAARRCASWFLALATVLSSSLGAEDKILVVHVTDVSDRPVAGVVLAPHGDGAVGPKTDVAGRTRIRLADAAEPNEWVSLQIVPQKDGPDWVFVEPRHKRVRIPPLDNKPESYAPVVVGKRGVAGAPR
ncbi:MAG TPA: hypothetical protein VNJ70_04540 [Thermoanaerobaculia bacterium]|nr:hypothetical protein [Thermoanaerobaculia bacterium]